MENKNNQRRSEEQLREENEQLKKKLEKEYGMQGYASCASPELENIWLKGIEAFEKAYKKEQDEQTRRSLPLN